MEVLHDTEAVREEIPEHKWNTTRWDKVQYQNGLYKPFAKVVTDRAKELARQLVEESDDFVEEYLPEADEGYDNDQDKYIRTIRRNVRNAYEGATGEVIRL